MSPKKRLRRGAEFWNSHRTVKIPNFTAEEFYERNFSNYNFSEVILDRSIFVNCVFNSTSFQGAWLCGAMFIRCVFKNVDFTNAELYAAVFTTCTFETVNFKNVKNDYEITDGAIINRR